MKNRIQAIDIRVVKNKKFREDIQKALENDSIISIVVSSLDKEDKGQLFNIPIHNITIFDEDIEGLCIWWVKMNYIEGKYMTMSNHFKNYIFIELE